MIVYHPKSDIYNCIFRFITIVNLQNLEQFEFSRLRIYDLYLLFPHLAGNIKYPRLKGMKTLKNKAMAIEPPYENLPDKKRLFSEMGDYHIQALQILLAKDILKDVNGKLCVSSGFYNESIASLYIDNQYISDGFYRELFQFLNKVPMNGELGLKNRTGLMEYRYDAV